MKNHFVCVRTFSRFVLCLAFIGLLQPKLRAQDTSISKEAITELDEALESAKGGSSEARKRLAVRRVIRDAEGLAEAHANSPSRFEVLEFLFRARQQLIALDDDTKHREALLDAARELVKAPDEFADLRLEADLLLSQAELAKQGADSETRANALRPFVDRYIDTPVGAKVVRLALVMALELGDNQLVTDLREMIKRRFAADLDMISFQRDKLGGQVFGAPFAGTFERSDGKVLRFPMDALGRSTMLIFWSSDNGGDTVVKELGAVALGQKAELAGRLEIISINLDDLPDAGESIVRGFGLDWQVLRLPGGRENPIYKTYVRSDPSRLTVSPTGQAAMIMSGSTRKRVDSDGTPDYARLFQSTLARQWTQPRYVQQVGSLLAGDFLVLDPMGDMDPTLPPELKATTGEPRPLTREAASVPVETLAAIQGCFVPAPSRYRMTHTEIRSFYAKAVELSRKAITDHPQAPDLWVVRNRLMIALLGLWKTDADLERLEEAAAEAKVAVAEGFPTGCDVIARFCLARVALREEGNNSGEVIDALIAESGGNSAPGSAMAIAALLSLEVADRAGFERYRELCLNQHGDNPMMWTMNAFLLDRYHRYWLFQVPFTAGWSYGRRENYFLTTGEAEDGHRMVRTELRTLDGKLIRIPDDLDTPWTAIAFAPPGPWSSKRDDGLPPSPDRLLKSLTEMAAKRPNGDLKIYLAVLGDDIDAIRSGLGDKELPCPVVIVPDGVNHPLVHQLGLLSEDVQPNSVLLGRDGRVATMISGLAKQSGRGGGTTLTNVVERFDEKFVSEAIAEGNIEAAKELILGLAPPFDPEAVDDRGRKLKKPQYSLAHLRARARTYLALGELELALADAEEVVQRQLGTDGGMSLRTDELDESEDLRDEIRAKMANE